MSEIGLWNVARVHPDMSAAGDADGRELSHRELTAAADRYGRGLQQLGLQTGDTLVMMLPNGLDLVAVDLAATQSGLYVVPVNWHLVGAEVAYLVDDCGAKAFVAHSRFADAATVGAASVP